MKTSLLHRLTQALLYICLAGEAVFLVLLPRILPILWLWDPIEAAGARYTGYFICWVVLVAGAGAITITLIVMMRSIRGGPFIMRNVNCLKLMGAVALSMVLFTAGTCLFYYRTLMLLVAMVELLCGLFSLVLCGIFKKAVEYRDENELTI